MTAVPADTPVMIPNEETNALVLPDVHVPPVAVIVSGAVAATHTIAGPETVPDTGNGLTVISCSVTTKPQELNMTYDMDTAPAETPDITPEDRAALALPLPAIQLPPGNDPASVTAAPTQTDVDPEIDAATGSGLTVTIREATDVPQELLRLYEIVAVPALTPVTTPPATVAFVLSTVHVPPGWEAVIVAVALSQTDVAPDKVEADGSTLTVTPTIWTSQ